MKVPKAKKLKSGAWRCQIMVDGERYSVTAPDKKTATAKAAAIKAKLEEGQRKKDSMKLADAIEVYISAKEHLLSPSTVREYRRIVLDRFQTLMQRDIYSLTHQILQRAVDIESTKVSAKTVKNAFSLVHATLAFFHLTEGEGITLPQVMDRPAAYLQRDEIFALIEAIRGDSCELPILMGLLLGMRRSEICGLCWDCVDLNLGTVTIRRSYVLDSNKHWVLRDMTKTETSQRVLAADPRILDLLRAAPHNSTDGRIITCHPGTIDRHLKRACEAIGATRTSPHGLRHTWSAVMSSIGVDDRVIIREGGWSKGYTLKRIYDYVFDAESVAAHKKKMAFYEEGSKLHTKLHTGK